jgi:hypothetical protein
LRLLKEVKEAEQEAAKHKEKENIAIAPKIPKSVQEGLSKSPQRRKSPTR